MEWKKKLKSLGGREAANNKSVVNDQGDDVVDLTP